MKTDLERTLERVSKQVIISRAWYCLLVSNGKRSQPPTVCLDLSTQTKSNRVLSQKGNKKENE